MRVLALLSALALPTCLCVSSEDSTRDATVSVSSGSFVNCGEPFAMRSGVVPDLYLRYTQGHHRLGRGSQSFEGAQETFSFDCPGQPVGALLGYGDKVRLVSADGFALTPLSRDGTLQMAHCDSCVFTLEDPTRDVADEDPGMETEGSADAGPEDPVKDMFALRSATSGAWVTLIAKDDTHLEMLRGDRTDFAAFKIVSLRKETEGKLVVHENRDGAGVAAPAVGKAAVNPNVQGSSGASSSSSSSSSSSASGASASAVSIKLPSAPRGLGSTQLTSTSAEFHWEEPTDAGDSPVSKYRLERCDDAECTVHRMVVEDKNVLSSVSTDNSQGKSYFFRVRARNAAGYGEPSVPLKITFVTKEEAHPRAKIAHLRAAKRDDGVPKYCKVWCEDDCGFTCRATCPQSCPSVQTAPSALCEGHCKGSCSEECVAVCPNVCPEPTEK